MMVSLYQNFQFNFPIGIFPRSEIGTKPIGHNWIQLDFFPTHFRPNWTRLDFFPTRQNWFQLGICWEIKFPIGNILRGKIYNWKKQNPTNSNSLNSNQLSPTEFPNWTELV